MLDLKDPGDLEVAKALIKSADGMTEGLRPGVMERLGLGPDVAMVLNPQLVYGRMTGWGQDGPNARLAGHDMNYQALTGALYYAGQEGAVPAVPPTLLGDIGGGAMYLAVGMLSGLLQAQRTGQGTVVDAAIVDGTSHMMALNLSMGAHFSREQRGVSALDGSHWSCCYRCSDGGFVAVQCFEPQFYALFRDLMGIAEDTRFDDQFDREKWPDQVAGLQAIFETRPRDHWAGLFADTDACVTPVLSPVESADDPHMRARGVWQADGTPSPAPRFGGAVRAPGKIAEHGADTDRLIKELREKGLL
jgi:crotonobetainyl-CoA:carnitine CoA-transferase CaiB-like acyl-CoA transferase